MTIKSVWFAMVSGGLIATGASASTPVSASPDATNWLLLVDGGQYDRSWTQAGALLRHNVSAIEWTDKVGATRQPLGSVVSRSLTSEKKLSSLPGAPDGAYDIVQFTTDFSNKHAAVETVVLAQERTGWKVDGYFVR